MTEKHERKFDDKKRIVGLAKGLIWMSEDFNAPLELVESLTVIERRLAADLLLSQSKEDNYDLRKVLPKLVDRLALLEMMRKFFNVESDSPTNVDFVRLEYLKKYIAHRLYPTNAEKTSLSATND